MNIGNFIPPSKETALQFYKFVREFETSISKMPGRYNWDNQIFQKFLSDNKLEIKPVSKSKYVTDLRGSNYIVFIYGDHKDEYDDKAHDLLRHIRNSISHGLISKTAPNKTIFDITDRNRNKSLTMRGNVNEYLFFELIRILKDTLN